MRVHFNKANTCDTEAAFLDLNLSIHNDTVSTKIYDKRDDFDFDTVNFPLLDGDVPRRPSYGEYILSSTANATLFFDLIFKYVHNMKTFVCDYHLDDPTTFLHHQIQVCSALARILALGYKHAFSVFPVHGLVIFQYRAQIQNL